MKPSTARRNSVEPWLDVSCLQIPDPESEQNGRDGLNARTTCKAVTANRVSDGVPIYFTASGTWSSNIAEVIATADPSRILAAAKDDPQTAIAPYVIEVTMVDGRVQPVGLRERIRAFGPTA